LSLTISLATRNRPGMCVNVIGSVIRHAIRQDTRIMVCVDGDDNATADAVRACIDKELDPRIFLSVEPREDSIGEKWNRGLQMGGTLFMPMCDDSMVLTHGFDEMFLKASAIFPDGIGCVYSAMANASFPAYMCITAKLADKLGFVFPTYFPFWFVDHWVDDVARLIGRIAYAPVETDQTQQVKAGTQEMRDLAFWATFFDAGRRERRAQARAIIDGEDFQEPEWRKELLRQAYPLVEHRSTWINDQVRTMARGVMAQPAADDRYWRIKRKAVEKLKVWAEDMEKNPGNVVEKDMPSMMTAAYGT
jgi:hypothetical protein